MTEAVKSTIRRVLNEAGRLPIDANGLDDNADLYSAGMSSHSTVDVMLALEDTFGFEFPTRMLNRSVFKSVGSIAAAVSEMTTRAV